MSRADYLDAELRAIDRFMLRAAAVLALGFIATGVAGCVL